MIAYRYYLCDVFTRRRFGGNPLAVFPEAEGMTAVQMQQLAREFNFSESTFVLPPEQGQTRRVRIFTPTTEVPFAGHPNVGTAFALAATGELPDFDSHCEVVFEESAGLVPVAVSRQADGRIFCELTAPEPLSLGEPLPVALVAEALSLTPEDIRVDGHPPQLASVGLPFVMVELANREALARAKVHLPGFERIAALGIAPDIHLYVRCEDEFDIRARMFAPFDNVPEDPATGSANGALCALLAQLDGAADGPYRYRIAQGVEMGRSSELVVQVDSSAGAVRQVRVGGYAVLVGEGLVYLD